MAVKREFEIIRCDDDKGICYSIKKSGKNEYWSNTFGWSETATLYRKFADVEADFNKLIKDEIKQA